MAIYLYKAKKGPTEILEGEIDAVSRDDAVDKLSTMGLVAVSVIEKRIRQETVIASPEGAKQSQKEIASSLSLLAMTGQKVLSQ